LLRNQLADLAGALTFAEGCAVLRIADVLATKGAGAGGYWERKGRDRFRRELAVDGLDAATVAEVVSVVDDAMAPEAVSLDAILEELKRRG